MDSVEFRQWTVDLSICTLIRVDVGHWTVDLSICMGTFLHSLGAQFLGVDVGCWTVDLSLVHNYAPALN